ncbi:phage capsid protein [Ruminococcus sp.]|uniref:Portal protein n=1 Tax=Siphoviridae sp. ctABi4 TaxID=2823566 RepID=A0A8S5LF81_9CAUD|nr:phage capsid protein [uncultured Ruminococcus sp.]DAD68606.1 MAG TPA: portal protein [Siphoviridae sp. ctABi4]DAH48386.1 MAG TPA: portal protein [Caudoviricetes sp.]
MQFINFLKGVWQRMFPLKDIKQALGVKLAITDDMMQSIEMWQKCFAGQAFWLSDSVISLRLEQAITREFANITLNEMTASVSNDKLQKIFETATEDLNSELQSGLATGAMVIKPLGGDKVQYISANAFVPIEFDARHRLVKVIFPEFKKIGDNYYTRLEYHSLDTEKGLTITNTAYVSASEGQLGREIPLAAVDEWASLPNAVTYPAMLRPAFGYFRTPIKNTIDGSSCGVSVYANDINLIRKIDTQFGRLDWEFESGERAIHVDAAAFKKEGTEKLNKRLYKAVDVDLGDNELFKDFSPAIRQSDITDGLNTYLRRLEFSVGLAYGDLSDPDTVAKTATEILSAKNRKYNTVSAIQKQLKYCLDDLVYALAFYNSLTTSGYTFVCDFKDSILTDEQTERTQDIQDLSLGIMRPDEYRMKWYGEDEKTAKKNLPQSSEVVD